MTMITGEHVAVVKETCRVILMSTQCLATTDIPALGADTISDRFEEFDEGVTASLEYIQNTSSTLHQTEFKSGILFGGPVMALTMRVEMGGLAQDPPVERNERRVGTSRRDGFTLALWLWSAAAVAEGVTATRPRT